MEVLRSSWVLRRCSGTLTLDLIYREKSQGLKSGRPPNGFTQGELEPEEHLENTFFITYQQFCLIAGPKNGAAGHVLKDRLTTFYTLLKSLGNNSWATVILNTSSGTVARSKALIVAVPHSTFFDLMLTTENLATQLLPSKTYLLTSPPNNVKPNHL
ncbi:hypothetical protein WA026_007457 [Henosepilachna vigintioctopunctata]|uniref:Uncharacterized protein n=1 Tax=Henosepilachna vigintioctopunctata TaxID=420089 RepID=A0AAW1UVW5_9CUCU